jgi:hypothetical protein
MILSPKSVPPPSLKALNMSTKPSFNLLELQEPFGKILSLEDFGGPTNDIAELIYLGQFSRSNVEDLLLEHGVNNIIGIKEPPGYDYKLY